MLSAKNNSEFPFCETFDILLFCLISRKANISVRIFHGIYTCVFFLFWLPLVRPLSHCQAGWIWTGNFKRGMALLFLGAKLEGNKVVLLTSFSCTELVVSLEASSSSAGHEVSSASKSCLKGTNKNGGSKRKWSEYMISETGVTIYQFSIFAILFELKSKYTSTICKCSPGQIRPVRQVQLVFLCTLLF